jgi:hypothetical protein
VGVKALQSHTLTYTRALSNHVGVEALHEFDLFRFLLPELELPVHAAGRGRDRGRERDKERGRERFSVDNKNCPSTLRGEEECRKKGGGRRDERDKGRWG